MREAVNGRERKMGKRRKENNRGDVARFTSSESYLFSKVN